MIYLRMLLWRSLSLIIHVFIDFPACIQYQWISTLILFSYVGWILIVFRTQILADYNLLLMYEFSCFTSQSTIFQSSQDVLTELLDLSTTESVPIKANKIDTGSPGVAQSVVSLTTDPEVQSSNTDQSHAWSRGREFGPSPVPCFSRDWSWNNFYSHSPSADLLEGSLSVCAYMVLINPLFKSSLPRKKVWLYRWTGCLDMTVAYNGDVKLQPKKQPKNNN